MAVLTSCAGCVDCIPGLASSAPDDFSYGNGIIPPRRV